MCWMVYGDVTGMRCLPRELKYVIGQGKAAGRAGECTAAAAARRRATKQSSRPLSLSLSISHHGSCGRATATKHAVWPTKHAPLPFRQPRQSHRVTETALIRFFSSSAKDK